jgi:hypothetical protein
MGGDAGRRRVRAVQGAEASWMKSSPFLARAFAKAGSLASSSA